jgi:hypothetical protein
MLNERSSKLPGCQVERLGPGIIDEGNSRIRNALEILYRSGDQRKKNTELTLTGQGTMALSSSSTDHLLRSFSLPATNKYFKSGEKQPV